MTQDLKAVDVLIRRLGGLVTAKDRAAVGPAEQAAIKTAVAEAAAAVTQATRVDGEAVLKRAGSHVDMAEEVIATFDSEVAKATHLQAAALPLCDRARELIQEARRLRGRASAANESSPT
jgi:hypothetical protein